MSRLLAILVACCALAAPSPVRAYLDGARFEAPALEGGGGGRFFSGAPADGYGCAVCHSGGTAPVISVAGLPAEGWSPGVTYDLTVAFPEGTRSGGAVVEIADGSGSGVGTLEAIPDAELEAADRCRTGTGATSIVPLADRALARTEVCGAARARVRWTAPTSPVTGLRVFASMVVANDSGDPTGDGATTTATPLRARGAPELEAGHLGQRCSIARGDPPGDRFLPAAWLIVVLALARRRATRIA